MSDYNHQNEILHGVFQERRMYDYFIRRQFCDVKIVVGKYKYFAHKFVLQTNSKYFRCNLNAETSEIVVSDDITIRRETVMKALEFLYTGKVELKLYDVSNLIKFSEIIAQENLQNYCLLFMRNILDGSKIITPINNEIDDYFIINFLELQKGENFLDISLQEIERYLKSDYLGIESEEEAFMALKLWIMKDWTNRKNHMHTLLQHIRFSQISLTFLFKEVKPLCKDLPNCLKILLDAIEWHNCPEIRSSLMMNTKPRKPKEVILIAGGYFPICKIIETYDTYLENISTAVKIIQSDIMNFSSAMYNNELLYIIGGIYENNITEMAWVINLVTKNLEELPSMTKKRSEFAIAIVESEIFAIGGYSYLNSMNTVERYCIARNRWKNVTSMLNKRCNHSAVVNDDEIYVMGGRIDENSCTNSMEVYNVQKNKWTNAPSMAQRRYNFAATALGDFIYVFGGMDNLGLEISSAEKFHVKTRKWTSIANMPQPRWGYASVAFQDKILCLGGFDVLEYNPQSDTWREIGVLNNARRGHSVFVVPFILNEQIGKE